MYSLLEDMSTVTTIPLTSLQKLANKAVYCICNCVEETSLKGETLTDINIGIGNLQINITDNNIQYKLIPNKHFEESIRTTLLDKKNPLTERAEDVLVKKILRVYKDLL